jgi:hypothetical protein
VIDMMLLLDLSLARNEWEKRFFVFGDLSVCNIMWNASNPIRSKNPPKKSTHIQIAHESLQTTFEITLQKLIISIINDMSFHKQLKNLHFSDPQKITENQFRSIKKCNIIILASFNFPFSSNHQLPRN